MTVYSYNRLARHDYQLTESYEAGICLTGSEVKSIRQGRVNLGESFVIQKDGEIFWHNAHIGHYKQAGNFSHEIKKDRKLLLHRRQINKILGAITKKGMTAVPIKLYTNSRGCIKLEISLAVGLKKVDKRHALKEKEWKRIQHRVLKQTNQEVQPDKKR